MSAQLIGYAYLQKEATRGLSRFQTMVGLPSQKCIRISRRTAGRSEGTKEIAAGSCAPEDREYALRCAEAKELEDL